MPATRSLELDAEGLRDPLRPVEDRRSVAPREQEADGPPCVVEEEGAAVPALGHRARDELVRERRDVAIVVDLDRRVRRKDLSLRDACGPSALLHRGPYGHVAHPRRPGNVE